MKKGLFVIGSILLISILTGVFTYLYFFSPNINATKEIAINIPTGTTYSELLQLLKDKKLLKNYYTFDVLAKRTKLFKKVYPGHYVFKASMTNKEIIRIFRGGLQTPVKVTFNAVRTKEELAGKMSKTLEIDSATFLSMLYDSTFLSMNGVDTNTVIALFIPNTYEMYWNTSQKKLMERVMKEYNTYWTEARKTLAKEQGLTPIQVSILASIVQAEQLEHPSERAIIAGLYLNRLRSNMLLQSDPTLIYATRDFSIKRVLNIHKAIESPYNTYLYEGLPPGPINLPEMSSLNAVLHPDKNNYLYMCAKEDFSGYHNFAVDYATHLKNANLYSAALNKMKIYK